MKQSAPLIGLVLGIVFLIVGFNYSNMALMILGFILGSLGLYLKFLK
jgi:hypothetical protein